MTTPPTADTTGTSALRHQLTDQPTTAGPIRAVGIAVAVEHAFRTVRPPRPEPDRCTEWRWWPLDALPEPTVGHTGVALEAIPFGTRCTAMGWT
ncbi:hypothetical protein ACGFWD_18820 [Streptomyces sp. NPDC048448]|uniref:hypothetical protein n=1 Tax=Streptomyces sp. NPDC048448 TaxID=3365554 RepID=UPI00371FF517